VCETEFLTCWVSGRVEPLPRHHRVLTGQEVAVGSDVMEYYYSISMEIANSIVDGN